MEAMAMGLPSIVTNWSGVTAFINPDVAYPLPYELVPAPTAEGHRWAQPSLGALRALMRRVVTHRAEAARVGARARALVTESYSQAAVTEHLLRRLAHLEPKLMLKREEDARAAAAAAAKRERREARRRRAREERLARRRQVSEGKRRGADGASGSADESVGKKNVSEGESESE